MVSDYFIPCAMNVIQDIIDADGDGTIQKVVGKLRQMGGSARHVDLLRRTHLTSKEFREAIATLTESQTIKTVPLSRGGNRYEIVDNDDSFAIHSCSKSCKSTNVIHNPPL